VQLLLVPPFIPLQVQVKVDVPVVTVLARPLPQRLVVGALVLLPLVAVPQLAATLLGAEQLAVDPLFIPVHDH